jgi:hypothetical protein
MVIELTSTIGVLKSWQDVTPVVILYRPKIKA